MLSLSFALSRSIPHSLSRSFSLSLFLTLSVFSSQSLSLSSSLLLRSVHLLSLFPDTSPSLRSRATRRRRRDESVQSVHSESLAHSVSSPLAFISSRRTPVLCEAARRGGEAKPSQFSQFLLNLPSKLRLYISLSLSSYTSRSRRGRATMR